MMITVLSCLTFKTKTYRHHQNFFFFFFLWPFRALGILIHEMLHGEPPFGYGGPDLPRRIAAGLPKDTRTATCTAAPGDATPHLAENLPTARSDTDDSSNKDGNTDGRHFLPIVRCEKKNFFFFSRGFCFGRIQSRTRKCNGVLCLGMMIFNS